MAQREGWSYDLEERYNRINNRQYKIRKAIESKIRHLPTGNVPWSAKLQRYRDNIEIWSMLLKKRRHRKISNRKLRRLLLRSDINSVYQKTTPELESELDIAFHAYKKAREDATSWRDEFLTGLAQSRSEDNGTEYEAELKQLRMIEQQKTPWNIKRMQGKLQRNATTKVFVTDHDGQRMIHKKEEIEEACIEENISRFSQSEDTPFMQEPLVSALGYLADTQSAEAILRGDFKAPPVHHSLHS
jgi:hypothetical protein